MATGYSGRAVGSGGSREGGVLLLGALINVQVLFTRSTVVLLLKFNVPTLFTT